MIKNPAPVQCVLPVVVALLMFGACAAPKVPPGSRAVKKEQSPMPVITVSILPQNWFVRRIASGRVRIVTLTGPGQNPHDYGPTPRQMAELAQSKIWILSGSEFEISLYPKIASLFPDLKIVNGTEGVKLRSLEEHNHRFEEHEGEDFSWDRHTWLGEEPARIMAGHVRDALAELDGANRDFYQANYEETIADIENEFNRFRILLAPLKGTTVFVYHPAFGYFLDEFGIIQEAVEIGGKEPSPRPLSELIAKARREKPAAIFIQAQFPVTAASAVARAAGARLVQMDPLSPDWLQGIRLLGEALAPEGDPAGTDGTLTAGQKEESGG
ncbi:MAG: zinc ABC transporter substrate-binding protein [Treponema sp.]|nr:zinc ABC transporter substrate-binding protein [Treponema sp.]